MRGDLHSRHKDNCLITINALTSNEFEIILKSVYVEENISISATWAQYESIFFNVLYQIHMKRSVAWAWYLVRMTEKGLPEPQTFRHQWLFVDRLVMCIWPLLLTARPSCRDVWNNIFPLSPSLPQFQLQVYQQNHFKDGVLIKLLSPLCLGQRGGGGKVTKAIMRSYEGEGAKRRRLISLIRLRFLTIGSSPTTCMKPEKKIGKILFFWSGPYIIMHDTMLHYVSA